MIEDVKEGEKLLSSVGLMIGRTDIHECYQCLYEVLRYDRAITLGKWIAGDSSMRTSCAEEIQAMNDILRRALAFYRPSVLDF